MTPEEEKIKRNVIINLCSAALSTDGAHHKQWYLEEILKTQIDEIALLDIRDREQWQAGIAP